MKRVDKSRSIDCNQTNFVGARNQTLEYPSVKKNLMGGDCASHTPSFPNCLRLSRGQGITSTPWPYPRHGDENDVQLAGIELIFIADIRLEELESIVTRTTLCRAVKEIHQLVVDHQYADLAVLQHSLEIALPRLLGDVVEHHPRSMPGAPATQQENREAAGNQWTVKNLERVMCLCSAFLAVHLQGENR